MLNELAEEMRKVALENPLDIKKIGIRSLFGLTRREVEVDGLPLVISFTYDIFSEKRHAWHVSFSHREHKELSSDLVQRLVEAFLGDDVYEMPSLWGSNVKQYIKMIKL